MYRPFIPWVKIVCSEHDGSYEAINDYDVKYKYEIDGVKYEKILKNVPHEGVGSGYFRNSRRTIYVDKNNPDIVKPGSQGGLDLLLMIIGLIILGAFLTYFAFRLYKKRIKEHIAQRQEQEVNCSKAGTGNRRNKKGDNNNGEENKNSK